MSRNKATCAIGLLMMSGLAGAAPMVDMTLDDASFTEIPKLDDATVTVIPKAIDAPGKVNGIDIPREAGATRVGPPETAGKARVDKQSTPGFRASLDDVRLESGIFTDDPGADTFSLLHASASLSGRLSPAWEFALGARVDGHFQTGNRGETQRALDYGENYLRWRGGENVLTLGTQNVLWGRVDEIPPVDRLSRADLSRFIMDRLPERRRAVPAVRLEQFSGDYKVDAVWVPVFDPAVMPDGNSVWHPVDRVRGRILGIKPADMPAAVVQAATLREADDGSGGAGVRVTRTGGNWDYGFSLQRSRQSVPYYQFSPPGAFTAVHPYSWTLGGELETQLGGATWRLETAWTSDVPVTARNTLQYRTEEGLDLVLGSEFFPGDSETRVTLQLAAHKTFADVPVLDRTRIYSITGELEHPFAHGRWRANLRFFAGLDERDMYLNPKLTYLGFEPHQLYISAHLFSGAPHTLGGFHHNNDLISLGWQAKF